MLEFFEKNTRRAKKLARKAQTYAKKVIRSTPAKLTYSLAFMAAEGISDGSVINTTINYLNPQAENNSTPEADKSPVDTNFIISCAVTAITAIPMAITVVHYLFGQHDHKHEHHHEHGHDDHHSHSFLQELMEFIIIGIPFGLLAAGGSHSLFSMFSLNLSLIIILDCVMGGVIAFGYWALHSAHMHNELSYSTLFNAISTRLAKFSAIMLGCGVVGGHFMQGLLDGKLFLDGIGLNNLIVTSILSVTLAIMITIFEGNTEMRAMLALAVEDNSTDDTNSLIKIAVGMAAIIHSWQSVMGLIEPITWILDLTRPAEQIPLYAKLLLLVTSIFLFGIPNARGFYATTLPACKKAFSKTHPNWRNKCNFFGKANKVTKHKTETTPLLLEENSVGTIGSKSVFMV